RYSPEERLASGQALPRRSVSVSIKAGAVCKAPLQAAAKVSESAATAPQTPAPPRAQWPELRSSCATRHTYATAGTRAASSGSLKAAGVRLPEPSRGADEDILPPYDAAHFAGLCDEGLLRKIREVAGEHVMLDYRRAREIMFTELFVRGGVVRDVYTHREA